MPNNEVDKFLDGLNEVPENPFEPNKEEPFTQPKKEEEKKDDVEEKLPFHKDPKVQRFIEKEINKRLADVKPIENHEDKKPIEEDSLTDVLTRIIGNDTPEKLSAIKDFKKAIGSMKEEAKQEALKELDVRDAEVKQAEIEAQNELNQGFENIEETFNVDITSNNAQARQTRSEFVDFIRRIAPKDENGQVSEFPDLEETFKLFQESKKQPVNNRAKDLASRSMNRSSEAPAGPTEGRTWRDIDRIFSRLTS